MVTRRAFLSDGLRSLALGVVAPRFLFRYKPRRKRMIYSDLIRFSSGIVGYWKMGEPVGTGSEAIGSASIAIPNFSDNFTRANGAVGISPSHHGWNTTGTVTSAIASNRLENPSAGTAYNWVDLGAVPTRMACSFTLNGAGGATAAVALISAPQPDILIVVHFTCARTTWAFGVSANFGVDGLTVLANGSLNLATDGVTSYNAAVSYSGDTATLELPDGTTQIVRDYRIASLGGRYGCWELVRDASTSPRFSSASATSASSASIPGIFGSGVTHGQAALIPGDTALSTLFHGTSANDGFLTNNGFTGQGVLYPADPTDWSTEVWLKTTGTDGWLERVDGPAGHYWLLYMTGGGLQLLSDIDGSFAGPAINNGVAHHVVMTRQRGGTTKLYLDGATSWSGAAAAYDFTIGTLRFSPADAASTFPGTLGHAAVYSRALTAAEVLNHYQVGKAITPTPSTGSLTVSDAARGGLVLVDSSP